MAAAVSRGFHFRPASRAASLDRRFHLNFSLRSRGTRGSPMIRRFAFGGVCALVAFMPCRAAAWNSIGHMAAAKLAYDQLEDGEKTKLFTLLQSHPHYKSFLA